jgi:AcrR family transcriptional regulator
VETRERILESAKLLFSERGFDGVTIRNISDEANVAVSAVNYHFKTKENLFFVLIEKFINDQMDHLLDMFEEPQSMLDFRNRLEIFTNYHICFHLRDLPLSRLVQVEFHNRSSVVQALLDGPIRKLFDDLILFVKKAVKKGYLRKDLDVGFFVSIYLGHIGNAVKNDDLNTSIKSGTLKDAEFRKRWVSNLISLLLDGAKSN